MFSVEPFTFNLLQGSYYLLSNGLSDAVPTLLLLLLHLSQISPQNVLLLGLSLAIILVTFPPITTSTALTEWVKFSSVLPECSFSEYRFVFSAHRTLPSTTIEGLHNMYFTDMGILCNITS